MKSADGLGELEQLLLIAVIRLRQDAYAVSVRDEVEKRIGRSLSRGTVYVTLERLERKGYLSSELGSPTPARGGKAKRMFAIRPTGVKALQKSLQDVSEMCAGLSSLNFAR